MQHANWIQEQEEQSKDPNQVAKSIQEALTDSFLAIGRDVCMLQLNVKYCLQSII